MTSEGQYDDLLYSILCNEGNIIDFFDKIFDFLYRRTDYFKIKGNESENLGLGDGEAENILRSVFCKYMEHAMSERNNLLKPNTDSPPIDYIVEETVVTSSEPDPIVTSSEPDPIVTSSDPTTVVTATDQEQVISTSEPTSTEMDKKVADPKRNKNLAMKERHPADQSDVRIPVMDPDSYNGAHYDDYSWAQTIKDIDIRIKVPSDVTSGKQVRVNIQQTCVKIDLFNGTEWNVLKEGDISWKINVEESTWTLVPREHIHICLQKMKERWWDSFFVGEPKIDLKAIDPSIAYEELDEESQAKIEELMYNEHLKRLGKPNIQQTKLHNILKGAWNAEGSPFKGQPFDPSKVNIQNSENFPL